MIILRLRIELPVMWQWMEMTSLLQTIIPEQSVICGWRMEHLANLFPVFPYRKRYVLSVSKVSVMKAEHRFMLRFCRVKRK